ncbi:hypothetical protein ACFLT1_05455 [Bacteroidota bacterium]
MKKEIFRFFIAGIVFFTLTSWGSTGHRIISLQLELFFNPEMEFYASWIPYISDHSSDADWRKKTDPDEFPKHFIDLDNYPSFKHDGSISQDLDSCITVYGSAFMDQNGYLPWATISTYDSLVHCLKNGDTKNGKRFAADLSHYVADGHMPLHLTRNYDGQYSENTGIHFRYEIEMIDRYEEQITYEGKPAMKVDNAAEYIFNYLYFNYIYADSVLQADDYARNIAPDPETDAYYEALWESTEYLTRNMYRDASHAFSNLLYTAWIEAGKP